MIRRVSLRNYRMFRSLDLDLSPSINVLVGRNDSGKSTLLEAVALALTGRLNGRFLAYELTPYLINVDATREYAVALQRGEKVPPPELIVDVFLDDSDDVAALRGTNNVAIEDACGVRIRAGLDQEFAAEYASFAAEPASIKLAPTEYYKVEWLGFSGLGVTFRSLPTAVSLIDPTAIRLHAGVDNHLQEIIRTHLEPSERVELSRQYRSLREEFSDQESVRAINARLASDGQNLADRPLSLAVDISQRYTWEGSLTAHLDDIPMHLVGKGEQHAIKVLLALGRRVEGSHVILVEEPETHLSHASLRRLLRRIEERCVGKQLIVTTHSTYVLNKLGLHAFVLLGEGRATRITDLPPKTVNYFKCLAGYDTLRLVLADGAILVEGPSDELIVQRCYLDVHGKLPIEDGIDVVAVGGKAHRRFLDLAVALGRRTWIVTDNDGNAVDAVRRRFATYLDNAFVSLHVGSDPTLRTLEPNIVAVNDLAVLCQVLGMQPTPREKVLARMTSDKTGAALKIFESPTSIVMPSFIRDAVES